MNQDEAVFRVHWDTLEGSKVGPWVTHELACELMTELLNEGFKSWLEKLA